MDFEEEIFLADNNDSSDIFFADDSTEKNQERQTSINTNKYEVDDVYSLLKIAEKDEKTDFKVYFRDN